MHVELRKMCIRDRVGAITILMDAKVLKRKGRVSTLLPVMVQSTGKKEVSGEIQISANVIDNFSKLSAADKAQADVYKRQREMSPRNLRSRSLRILILSVI